MSSRLLNILDSLHTQFGVVRPSRAAAISLVEAAEELKTLTMASLSSNRAQDEPEHLKR
jgi:hypothetical protein